MIEQVPEDSNPHLTVLETAVLSVRRETCVGGTGTLPGTGLVPPILYEVLKRLSSSAGAPYHVLGTAVKSL